MNDFKKKGKWILVFLPFLFLLLLLAQQDKAFTQDLGRHLKTGEIIIKCLCVPKTNLFSFTEPDHSFINHHWFSEVVFYTLYSRFGEVSLILFKVIGILLAFAIVFYLALKKGNLFWSSVIAFPYMYIFSERFDTRPEIASFVFLGLTILLIDRFRHTRNIRFLYPLPLIELVWVNSHIYFFVGILLFAFLILEQIIKKRTKVKKQLLVLFFLSCAVLFLNPNGIYGALYPLNVFQNYGYTIVENQNIFFLNSFFFNPRTLVFEIVSVGLMVLMILARRKNELFFVLASLFAAGAAYYMIRNFPLFVLITFPYAVYLATICEKQLNTSLIRSVRITAFLTVAVVASWISVLVISSPFFGLGYIRGADKAVDYLIDHHIHGPIFNNFDIGSYLLFRLYPSERVFVDGRPEAYSVEFFNTYKRMQEDPTLFSKIANTYHIHTIFFAYSDITPWGQTFVQHIIKDPSWKKVYIDETNIILIKNKPQNSL